MSEVSCPKCNGDLKLDLQKSQEESFPIYTCDCGVYGYFKILGEEIGRKTKEKLDLKKLIQDIPF